MGGLPVDLVWMALSFLAGTLSTHIGWIAGRAVTDLLKARWPRWFV